MAVSYLSPNDIRYIIDELNAGTSFADIKTALTEVDGTFLDTQETALKLKALAEKVARVDGPELQAALWRGTVSPVAASILPGSGSTSGLNTVFVEGSGFVEGATVKVGGHDAVVKALASTVISIEMPPHAAATGLNVVVANPNGNLATLDTAYDYEAP